MTLEDLGSANGFRVDGVPVVGQATVALGAILEIGAVRLVVRVKPAGAADPMAEVQGLVGKVAESALSLILLGETGVGKAVLAEQIHAASRRSGPLVRIHCAGLAQSLLESELFGYERGAFTGATQAKAGLIESADGDAFLDELGEMPEATQTKLLRVLESREVRRLGALRAKAVDVRFVSATHRDLRTLAALGRFREDLLFRLNGLTVRIPPLRERRGEILALAERFLRAACARAGRAVPQLSEGVQAMPRELSVAGERAGAQSDRAGRVALRRSRGRDRAPELRSARAGGGLQSVPPPWGHRGSAAGKARAAATEGSASASCASCRRWAATRWRRPRRWGSRRGCSRTAWTSWASRVLGGSSAPRGARVNVEPQLVAVLDRAEEAPRGRRERQRDGALGLEERREEERREDAGARDADEERGVGHDQLRARVADVGAPARLRGRARVGEEAPLAVAPEAEDDEAGDAQRGDAPRDDVRNDVALAGRRLGEGRREVGHDVPDLLALAGDDELPDGRVPAGLEDELVRARVDDESGRRGGS